MPNEKIGCQEVTFASTPNSISLPSDPAVDRARTVNTLLSLPYPFNNLHPLLYQCVVPQLVLRPLPPPDPRSVMPLQTITTTILTTCARLLPTRHSLDTLLLSNAVALLSLLFTPKNPSLHHPLLRSSPIFLTILVDLEGLPRSIQPLRMVQNACLTSRTILLLHLLRKLPLPPIWTEPTTVKSKNSRSIVSPDLDLQLEDRDGR